MEVSYDVYRLTFKHAFKISHGSYPFRDSIIVRIRDGIHIGYGEASAIDYYERPLKAFPAPLMAQKQL